jgi:hypothetical protein
VAALLAWIPPSIPYLLLQKIMKELGGFSIMVFWWLQFAKGSEAMGFGLTLQGPL